MGGDPWYMVPMGVFIPFMRILFRKAVRGGGGLDEPTRDVCGGGKMSRLLEISARSPPLRTSATRVAWYLCFEAQVS